MYDLSTEAREIVAKLLRAIWPLSPFVAAPPKEKDTSPAGKSAGRTVLPAEVKDETPPPSRKKQPARRVALEDDTSEHGHRGWLAAVIVHGGATAGAMAGYMQKHTHLMPYLMAYANFKKSDGDIHLDHSSGSLLMNHFAEFPPPSLPFCGPSFFLPADLQQEWKWSWTDMLFAGLELVDTTRLMAGQYTSTPYLLEPGWLNQRRSGEHRYMAAPELEFPSGWLVRDDGVVLDTVGAPMRHGTMEVRPAQAVIYWSQKVAAAGGVWAERNLALAPVVLQPYTHGALKIPEYYRKTAALRNDWYWRLARWYHRAAWLVWAGEMMREHLPSHHSPPEWWEKHCACWGVGTAHKPRLERLGTMADVSSYHLRIKDSASYVEAMLRLIVQHTPPPGSPGTLGEQIAPGTVVKGHQPRRHMLDMPSGVGAVDPPYSMDWWMTYAIGRWYAQQTNKAAKGFNWQNTVISVEANLCSMGFGSALTGTITSIAVEAAGSVAGELVSKVLNIALQNCFKMARGDPPADAWNWGDVVGLAGDALNVIGVSGSGEVAKMLPDGMWQSLQRLGSEFPHVDGVDNDKLFGYLDRMRSSFDSLRNQGWPYIDQAYGGLGLAESEYGAKLF